MTNILYDALIARHAHSDALFLTLDDGTTRTYAQFVERVAQLAHVLKEADVNPGDRVVVQAPKLLDTIALYGATTNDALLVRPPL